MKLKQRILGLLGVFWLGFGWPAVAFGAPYFFVTGSTELIRGYSFQYSIYLYTDGQPVTAAQTVLTFDPAKVEGMFIGTLNSRCSFWAPADPLLGYGNQTTPYFHNNNKVVIACGFSNPGYNSTSAAGDLIAKVTLTASETAQGTTQLTFSDTLFRYIGNVITPSPGIGLTVTAFNSTQSAFPTPTPYPTPTPVNARTISADSLNLVNVDGSTQGQTGTFSTQESLFLESQQLNQIETTLNNEIPAPPELSPRPSVTPLASIDKEDTDSLFDDGEVLSLKSLRELLLPGRSEADQTVVLINLISAISFFVILAILVWRLIMISRMNRLKSRHLQDLLAGELSALESKLAGEVGADSRELVTTRLEELREKLEKK
jgi:hypothetical protein